MRRKVFIVGAVIVLIVGGYFLLRSKKPDYNFVIAKKADLIQEVSVTGKVKPAESVDLAFEKSGKVAWINAEVGEEVEVGRILVSLVNSDLTAQLAEAEAGVKVQQAKLEELRQGTRPEEIKVQEVTVENAKVSLEEAKKNLVDKIQDAYTKSDDAIRNKVDQIFSNPRTATPQLNYYLNIESVLKTDIEWRRFLIESKLNSWESSLAAVKTNLDEIKLFLDKLALAVNSAGANSNLSQTTLDAWKSDVSTARTNINTAIINLSAAVEKLKTAESTLLLEENELALKKAGAVAEQITSQEAKVEEAEANVKNIQAQIAKTILWAPINGVVTKQETKVGEIVSANSIIISIISSSGWEIKANIPEVDIAKVKISNPASITLDAYGPDIVFEARVVKIDPGETIIEGMATYKTTLQFLQKDERIKSGMTANIDILADKRENVLVIPQRAVISKDGEKSVKIFDGKNIKEILIKTGLRGSDGNIEILEGVKEGEKIVLP